MRLLKKWKEMENTLRALLWIIIVLSVFIYLFICFSGVRKVKISIKLLFFGVLKQRFVTKTWVSFLFKQKIDWAFSLNCPGQWFSLSVKGKI